MTRRVLPLLAMSEMVSVGVVPIPPFIISPLRPCPRYIVRVVVMWPCVVVVVEVVMVLARTTTGPRRGFQFAL